MESPPTPVKSQSSPLLTRSNTLSHLDQLRTNSNPNLVSLHVQDAKIQPKSLLSALSTNTTLEYLNLRGSNFKKKGAEELIQVIEQNRSLRLTDLILSENELESEGARLVLDAVAKSTSLKTLDMTKNKIKQDGLERVGEVLMRTNSLRELKLSQNPKIGKEGLGYLCDGLKYNTTLKVLNCVEINIGVKGCGPLAESLNVNRTLTVLDISSNSIKDEGLQKLAQVLRDSKSISEISIADNGLTKKSLSYIIPLLDPRRNPPLRVINLSNNKLGKQGITELAHALETNPTLQALYIEGCGAQAEGASKIFAALRFNRGIHTLDMSNNKISDKSGPELLDLIKDNVVLQTLYLSRNNFAKGLEGIHEDLAVNNSLTSLYLSNNPLSSEVGFDIALALRKNTTLQVLEMKETNINAERSQILLQSYQESLYLTHMWVNVHYFDVKKINYTLPSMKLRRIPMQFLRMTHLKILDLAENKIRDIPPAISDLMELRELILSKNMVEFLPTTMCSMTKLQVLNLEQNPMKVPPKEIIKRGAKETLGYLRDLSEGSQIVYRTKLMVVGQENVGKTTLITKFLKGKSKKLTTTKKYGNITNPDTNISTDGIDIDEWTMKVRFTDKEGKQKKIPVTCSVWDFAGQELYYASHQFFLSKRSVYIVAFDMRFNEEHSRVEFWLQSIRSRAKGAPIIILGTHADDKKCTPEYIESTLNKIKTKYSKRFPGIKSIMAADVTKNVKDVKLALKNIIASLETMGESMPLSYLELEKLIITERAERKQSGNVPLVDWAEFSRWGTDANIGSEQTMKRAAQLFHDLGTIVHYQDKKSELRDIVILDPQFITDLLCTIITTKHTFVKGGILLHKNLEHIWRDPQQFPKHLHPLFLALLEKFELSFPLDAPRKGTPTDSLDIEGKSMIPSLLSNDAPLDLPTIWDKIKSKGGKGMDRYVQLAFIPSGFIARLLIRLFRYADSVYYYWKNGAILSRRNQEEFILVQYLTANDNYNEQSHYRNAFNVLRFSVISYTNSPVATVRVVIDTVRSLISKWFHISVVSETIPCPKCRELFPAPPLRPPVEEEAPPPSPKLRSSPSSSRLTEGNTPSPVKKTPSSQSLLKSTSFEGKEREALLSTSMVANEGYTEPHLFMVKECTNAVVRGESAIQCPNHPGTLVLLDDVIPDITMKDMESARISYRKIDIGKELGKGAFGVIYEGKLDGEPVAVKSLLLPSGAMSLTFGNEEEANPTNTLSVNTNGEPLSPEEAKEILNVFDEFRREVFMMQKLKHPCIVAFKGYTINPFSLVMEKVEKGNLYNYINNINNTVSWAFRITVAQNVAAAMTFLHSFEPKILHNDLKSPNVLLCSTNDKDAVVAKLADFGTASELSILAFKEKSEARVVALPTWLAPEVLLEEPYTEKSEVYAFGIIMWELVARKHPFSEYRWMSDLERAVVEGKRPVIPGDTPEVWKNLMVRCWDQDPSKRPPFSAVHKELMSFGIKPQQDK